MRTRATVLAGLAMMLCSGATALAGQVTFQLNMSAQVALGNFNPASDTVSVAGGFNGWNTTASPLAATPGDPNIWTATLDVTGEAGSTVEYKFVLLTLAGTTWEGNVGPGGPNGNRTLTVAVTDQTLPVVFFNNVTSGSTVSSDVTFQVNMSVQIALGAFDPASGTVSVAGEFNGWSTSDFMLTQNVSDPNVWVGTRTLTGAANSPVSYKFVMNGGSWEGNVGPNGAANRALTLTSGPQTVPVVFFNNVTAVPSNVPITFQVNLGVQIAKGNFNPATGTVSVAGDLLNDWNTTASVLTRSATDNNLWTGTFEVSGAAGTVMLFKYVLNDSTWESIANRTYTLSSTDAQTLTPVFFNDVGNLGSLAIGAVSGGRLTLSWTAGPQIRLQTAPGLRGSTWQDVPNTSEQSSATVPVGSEAAFFRLVGP